MVWHSSQQPCVVSVLDLRVLLHHTQLVQFCIIFVHSVSLSHLV